MSNTITVDKTFILFWKDGRIEEIQGKSIGLAMAAKKYGLSVMEQLAFFSDNPESKELYNYIEDINQWVKK